jgi:hypothetical protein
MILTLEHNQGTLKSVLLILVAYNESFGNVYIKPCD